MTRVLITPAVPVPEPDAIRVINQQVSCVIEDMIDVACMRTLVQRSLLMRVAQLEEQAAGREAHVTFLEMTLDRGKLLPA